MVVSVTTSYKPTDLIGDMTYDMTYIEQVIREAVEKGGWRPTISDEYLMRDLAILTEKGMCDLVSLVHSENRALFLDPDFWQALGKARRWRTWCDYCKHFRGFEHDPKDRRCTGCSALAAQFEYEGWRHFWIEFIHHLADGKEANSFFSELYQTK